MNSAKELRKLTVEELQAKLLSLRKEQFTLRMKKANGALDKTHFVTMVRKAIAKVKTIMTEKAGKSHVE
jgi:large subunit ribosomal protein L29